MEMVLLCVVVLLCVTVQCSGQSIVVLVDDGYVLSTSAIEEALVANVTYSVQLKSTVQL